MAPAAPLPRPSRGKLAAEVSALVSDLYLGPSGGRGADPSPLIRILRRFPAASDYFDGGQHDCQEVLTLLLDLLHDDLNTVAPKPASAVAAAAAENHGKSDEEPTETDFTPRELSAAGPAAGVITSTGEAAKAEAAWAALRRRDASPVSDLFQGQLQSCVVCSKCGGRFTTYELFWELSLPLVPKPGSTLSLLFGLKQSGGGLSLQDCLRTFTAEERLEGEEAFSCEVCKEKTLATKRLTLHRLPDNLVLHVKRFRHRDAHADKLTTNVAFPLKALDLGAHCSSECPQPPEQRSYDLYAVSNHTGNVGGGHYTATCRVSGGDGDKWWHFNDDVVTAVAPTGVATQNAYILFYSRRRYKDPEKAAAVYAEGAKPAAPRHVRSRSGGSAGSGGGGGFFNFSRGGEAKPAT